MMDQTQNPYASPEEVTEVEDARGMTLDEAQALGRGLGWFRWGAVGWLVMTVLAWSVLAANCFGEPLGRDGVEAVESGAWYLGFLLFLPTILTSLPGVTSCLWAVARAEEDRDGRGALRGSCVAGVLGFVLMLTLVAVLFSVILWIISFWCWFRFLEFMCRKAGMPEMVGKARAMVTVMIVFLIAVPFGMFLHNGFGAWFFRQEMSLSFALTWAVLLLPGVYFGLEIWVLGRIIEKIRNLE